MQRLIPSLLIASGLALGLPSIALAQPAPPSQQPSAAEDEPIFGSQMMTDQERTDYRMRMRGAMSAEDRARIRDEHHADMLARARERGITLPDEPPGQGIGRGPGMGPGSGMGGSGTGPGPGMGPGSRMGPGGPGPDQRR